MISSILLSINIRVLTSFLKGGFFFWSSKMAAEPGEWRQGLCDCFDNFGLCLMAYFAPCVVFGRNAEALQTGDCCLCGLAFFVPVLNLLSWINIRGAIREHRSIDGSTLADIITICCCPLCALIQEAHEIKYIPSLITISRD